MIRLHDAKIGDVLDFTTCTRTVIGVEDGYREDNIRLRFEETKGWGTFCRGAYVRRIDHKDPEVIHDD